MTTAVIEALDIPGSAHDNLAQALRSIWDGRVALVWTRNDIARICDLNNWKRPDLAACDELLDSLLLETDGVTTATIEGRLRDAGLAVPE